MSTPRDPRWYYAHVDFGPGVRPWLVAVEGDSPEDVRAHLEDDFAVQGVTVTIREVGLLADLSDHQGKK